ncbi:protein FAM200A-like [Rhinoraja longicauda]
MQESSVEGPFVNRYTLFGAVGPDDTSSPRGGQVCDLNPGAKARLARQMSGNMSLLKYLKKPALEEECAEGSSSFLKESEMKRRQEEICSGDKSFVKGDKETEDNELKNAVTVKYSNQCLAPSKLQTHLRTKHGNHQNKYLWKQQNFFQSMVKNDTATKKTLLLASLQIAHVFMKEKKPYTEAEKVVRPCLKIVANLLHSGKQAVDKVVQIPLTNDTMKLRSTMIAEDVKHQLMAKLLEAPFFALQFDEPMDIKNDAQLIVHCRLPDQSLGKIVEHYLFGVPVGEQTTGEFIFSKLDEFMENENLSWSKYVATDSAAAMMGKHKGATARIKEKSHNHTFLHCCLHREALAAKKLNTCCNDQKNELEELLQDVVKIVNAFRPQAKKCRLFSEQCKDMSADHMILLLHSEVRWLSRGRVLKELNLSLQGKGGDIFDVLGKIEAMKMKITMWHINIRKGNFSNFKHLERLLKECEWEEKQPDLEKTLKDIISDHLQLLSKNLKTYFPQKHLQDLENQMWIVNPFITSHIKRADFGEISEVLMELHYDFTQKSSFEMCYYGDYWVGLFAFPEYKSITLKALQPLVMMTTTFLSEQLGGWEGARYSELSNRQCCDDVLSMNVTYTCQYTCTTFKICLDLEEPASGEKYTKYGKLIFGSIVSFLPGEF